MDASLSPPTLPTRWGLLALTTVLVAALDMLFAIGFWHLQGVPALPIMQSIAAGVLGRAAYQGGLGTALLGLALHGGIAWVMVVTYDRATRLLPALHRRAWLNGLLYGLVLYSVMTYIVLPLSAAGPRQPRLDWTLASVFANTVLVGLPCALLVRRAQRMPTPPAAASAR